MTDAEYNLPLVLKSDVLAGVIVATTVNPKPAEPTFATLRVGTLAKPAEASSLVPPASYAALVSVTAPAVLATTESVLVAP